jgi:hypothetical protein
MIFSASAAACRRTIPDCLVRTEIELQLPRVVLALAAVARRAIRQLPDGETELASCMIYWPSWRVHLDLTAGSSSGRGAD